MDIVLRSIRLPTIGETVVGKDVHYIPGGKGANQAIAAARLGGRVLLVGKVGDDDIGKKLTKFLQSEPHLKTKITATHKSSGLAFITVDTKGNNTIIILSGSNALVSPKYVHQFEINIREAHAVLSQLEIPIPTIDELFKLAKRHNKLTILNAAPAKPIPPGIFRMTDYFVVNETELMFYTKQIKSCTTKESIIRAGKLLLRFGIKAVIVTRGSRGAIAIGKNFLIEQKGVRVNAIDSTAAGDCFVGALAVELTRNMPLARAMMFANYAAAMSTQRLGARMSLPTLRELKKLN